MEFFWIFITRIKLHAFLAFLILKPDCLKHGWNQTQLELFAFYFVNDIYFPWWRFLSVLRHLKFIIVCMLCTTILGHYQKCWKHTKVKLLLVFVLLSNLNFSGKTEKNRMFQKIYKSSKSAKSSKIARFP